MKKIIKKTVRKSLDGTKRLVLKYPGVKNRIKSLLNPYFQASYQTDDYTAWTQKNMPDAIALVDIKRLSDKLSYRPMVSIIVPTYNTKPQYLKDCLDSVLAQVYDNWELCVVDDASTDKNVRDMIKSYAQLDHRIKYKFNKQNKHIADATNVGIGMAEGEFVSLFDHDDILWPNALYEIVKALNENKDLDFIYSDEDKITDNRHEYCAPFFKPDWNPDFLHSVNYITHFSTIRRSLLNEVGGLRGEYNGAQDWDLFLRITNTTDRIYHIPTVIYSWRIHDLSTAKNTDTKPYVVEAQQKAIVDDLHRKGYDDVSVKQDTNNRGYWEVRYPIKDEPLISIVIPTKNQYKVVTRCIKSIYKKTTYKNFEIVLVDTGSTDKRVLRWYEALKSQYDNLRVVNWPEQPFSYARSCNEGARHAKGELLVMLNNDTEVITPDWLEVMAGDAQRKEIGAVGCLLFFPDQRHVQHAGIGIGLGGVAANSFSMIVNHGLTPNQHIYLNTKHNITAVTAACLMIKKKVYDEVGGFDETFRVTYNDVDLCLRLREKGYYNLYTPYVQLLHHESISVGLPEEVKKRDTKEFRDAVDLFKKRWQKYIDHDPDLNPNFSRDNALYDVDPKYQRYR